MSIEALTLLTGMIAGWLIPQVATAAGRPLSDMQRFFVVLAGGCAAITLATPSSEIYFSYRGAVRWNGGWSNPNHTGLVMALGALCALILFRRAYLSGTPPLTVAFLRRRKTLALLGLGAACVVCVAALIFSYSRGSILALAAGVLYWQWRLRRTDRAATSKTRAAIHCAVLAIVSTAVIAVHFIHHPLAFRVVSLGNPADASWANRVAAGLGGLEMMLDKPLSGFGFRHTIAAYKAFYMPYRIHEPEAIINCEPAYIGASLGAVFLCLLVAYVYHSGPTAAEARRPIVSSSLADESLRAIIDASYVVILSACLFNSIILSPLFSCVFWFLVEMRYRQKELTGPA